MVRMTPSQIFASQSLQKKKLDLETTTSLSLLPDLRNHFIKERCIVVPSTNMISILLSLGATPNDLAALPQANDQQPFTLTAGENLVHYDSGQVRSFAPIEQDLNYNSAIHALFEFKTFMLQGIRNEIKPRPNLNYMTQDYICTLFHLRTVTTSDRLGEHALEGVHSDGVYFTMTTYLSSRKMTSDSATTFMHDTRETNGIPFDQTNPEYRIAKFQHGQLLDTLLFVDHKRKHSLSPVKPVEVNEETTRDMLAFFTRKLVCEDHVSWKFDAMERCGRLRLDVNLNIG